MGAEDGASSTSTLEGFSRGGGLEVLSLLLVGVRGFLLVVMKH